MVQSILLVDSDTNFRRALAIGLRLEHYAVEEAGSLVEARRRLAARSFDFAVVDLLLPGGDGLDLAASVLESSDCKVMISSAHQEAFQAAGHRVPLALQLEKPFSVDQLLRLLDPVEPARAVAAALEGVEPIR